MSTFILKFILCSGVLYGAYHFLLKNEKTLRFNRYFLLSILGFSLLFPLVTTKSKIVETTPIELEYNNSILIDTASNFTPSTISATESTPFTISSADFIWTLYSLVSLFFLVRFVGNLIQLRKLRAKGLIVEQNGLVFCLREDINASFTFLKTIFTNKSNFETGALPEEIIRHEAVHANQRHSIDIIIIELVQCLLWFNPLLYLIKSAIKLNHEYLADEQVCAETLEISKYQKTLIQYVYNSKQQPVMASQLTYGQTKNRLNMMVKKFQMRSAALRILVTLFITSAALWGFGETEVIAQDRNTIPPPPPPAMKQNQDIPPPPPPRVVRLNAKTMVSFEYANGDQVVGEFGKLNERQLEIFRSAEGKGQVLLPPPPPALIQQSLLEEFSQDKYKVWIDGELINSKDLMDYDTKDFYLYNKQLSVSENGKERKFTGIEFITKDAWEKSGRSEGKWIPYNSLFEEKEEQLEEQEEKEEAEKNEEREDNQEDYGILQPNTLVKIKAEDGRVIQKPYGQLTMTEKEAFFAKESNAQVFNVFGKTTPMNDQEWSALQDSKKYGIWLNGDQVENSELSKLKPTDIYKYDLRKMNPSMRNLGDFDIWYFAHTTDWVKENNTFIDDDYGTWFSYQELYRLNKEVAQMSAKN